MKNVIRVCSFLAVLIISLSIISYIIIPKQSPIVGPRARNVSFYKIKKDSLDVIFIGASTFLSGISPMEIWEQNGITSHLRASPGQSPVLSYYILLETLKYQHPKVVVLDVNSIYSDADVDRKEGYVREIVDALRFSEIKIKAIYNITKLSKDQSFASFLFPILRYHSRWNELKRADLKFSQPTIDYPLMGFIPSYFVKPIVLPGNFMKETSDEEVINRSSLQYYDAMIKLCASENIDVVLLVQPRKDWSFAKYQGIKQFAFDRNVQYLDYSLPENYQRVGIDSKTDFKDNYHLNVFGAIKVSKDFGDFLTKTYNLEDKRDNPRFENWNSLYKKYRDETLPYFAKEPNEK